MNNIALKSKANVLPTFALSTIFLALSHTAHAQVEDIDVKVNGFIRADYGNGDRYPESQGEDVLGVSRSALAVTAQKDNIRGVFVIGTEVLTINNGSEDGNVDIKDAYIVFDDVFGNTSFKVGAQPLLFGLKPAGYPFDHSLVESIEYGAAGGFAVANQFGPAAIANVTLSDNFTLDVGLFDLDTAGSDTFEDEGSALTDNGFIQIRANNLFGAGIYGVAGVEQRYIAATDDSSAIVDVGVGIKLDNFDLSVEWISLEQEITGTADDESYIVVESYFNVSKDTGIYVDYATADELGADTIRVGLDYDYTKEVRLSVEYAGDTFDGDAQEDVDSINFRAALNF